MTHDNKSDWEANCERLGLTDREKQLLHVPNGEAGACAVIRLMLVSGVLASTWDLPPITNWEQEFAFPRGRVDFALFHVDGSVSLVEVKNAGSDRDILCGIGQLSLYAIQAGQNLPRNKVRRILAVAIDSAKSLHLDSACHLAGVTFECIGSVPEHQEGALTFLLSREPASS